MFGGKAFAATGVVSPVPCVIGSSPPWMGAVGASGGGGAAVYAEATVPAYAPGTGRGAVTTDADGPGPPGATPGIGATGFPAPVCGGGIHTAVAAAAGAGPGTGGPLP